MFRRLPDRARPALRFTFDGAMVEAQEGDSIAAALLAAGHTVTRHTVISGAPRAPFCMMGVCFECLVTVDGVANRQGCMLPVTQGMEVRTQRGAAGTESAA